MNCPNFAKWDESAVPRADACPKGLARRVQLVKEYRFPEVGSSGRPIVMSAGNKLFRRFLVGGVPALAFFLHCGTALNGLNASPSPAWTFPAERDRADLSLEAGMWRSEFQWADSKKSPDDTSGKSDTPMTANHKDAAFSGLTAAVDCFENESLLDTEATSVCSHRGCCRGRRGCGVWSLLQIVRPLERHDSLERLPNTSTCLRSRRDRA